MDDPVKQLLPDISHLELDELLALRATVNMRLEEKRDALLQQAERVDGLIGNGKKRRNRKSGDEASE